VVPFKISCVVASFGGSGVFPLAWHGYCQRFLGFILDVLRGKSTTRLR
jgi:hypothetical protein